MCWIQVSSVSVTQDQLLWLSWVITQWRIYWRQTSSTHQLTRIKPWCPLWSQLLFSKPPTLNSPNQSTLPSNTSEWETEMCFCPTWELMNIWKHLIFSAILFSACSFFFLQEFEPGSPLSCVYWNISEWIVDGCSVLKTNSSYTVCSCDHLSTFALIMQTSRPSEVREHL